MAKRRDVGFTLLELLIVLIIISITLGVTTLSFRSNNIEKEWMHAMESVCVQLQSASQMAVSNGKTVYIVIRSQGIYQDLEAERLGYFDVYNQWPLYEWSYKTLNVQLESLSKGNIAFIEFYSDGTAGAFSLVITYKNSMAHFSGSSVGKVECKIS